MGEADAEGRVPRRRGLVGKLPADARFVEGSDQSRRRVPQLVGDERAGRREFRGEGGDAGRGLIRARDAVDADAERPGALDEAGKEVGGGGRLAVRGPGGGQGRTGLGGRLGTQ